MDMIEVVGVVIDQVSGREVDKEVSYQTSLQSYLILIAGMD